MTRTYLEIERDKLKAAIAYGINSKGNLNWARAKLAAVETALARLPPA